MVLHRRLSATVQALDVFAPVKEEALSAGTSLGFSLTLCSVVLCTTLLFIELSAFLSWETASHLEMDSDQSTLLRVNFDVTMLDLACDYATVGSRDAFGTTRTNLTRDVTKQRIDHEGTDKGHAYEEEELAALEHMEEHMSSEEKKQLDQDWMKDEDRSSTQDDFHRALSAHDFVFVLFCVPTWAPCKLMDQVWTKFSGFVKDGGLAVKDADGAGADIHAMYLNCDPHVGFMETCQAEAVKQFPTIRLYHRTVETTAKTKPKHETVGFAFPPDLIMLAQLGVMIKLNDKAIEDSVNLLKKIATDSVSHRHLHRNASRHAVFAEGCRLSGHIDVPRVPGTIHIEARNSADTMLNYAFTNVSHTVNHLGFGAEDGVHTLLEKPSSYWSRARATNNEANIAPLDGRSFIVSRFHQAPHHFVRVVHTRLDTHSGARFYLQTHQWNARNFPRAEAPQAQFSIDLAPVEVVVTWHDTRRWYDFLTSVFAVVGGAAAVMKMTYMLIRSGAVAVE